MMCTITMVLEVPNDFDEQQILEDIESAIMNRTCFDVVNFGDFEIANEEDGKEIRVPYVSVWDGGTAIETTAKVNIETGEVTDIELVDVGGLDICEEQHIIMNDEIVYVYEDEHGFDYWADINGEYEN